ncbi:MAG: Rpn family recombination-promoting nuclease/putative transposase [Sphaerochaeta sp.]|nr:Rpn family recombination-promoting nuclease/putative transposase [Sphaerochaeta sp.]
MKKEKHSKPFKLMDPKIDFVFKLLFGNEKDTSFLIAFLNAALELEGEKTIKSVIIMSPNNDKEKQEEKYSIMDVKAKANDETIINIEIQLKDEHNMRYRTVYYLSKMIAKRLKEGDNYKSIYKTVAINILNFDLLDSGTRFHNRYRFTEIETKQELTDVAEIQFMELPALRRYIQENETTIKDAIGENKLLEWLLFIDNPESELAKMAETKNEIIGRARDMLKTLSKDEKLQEEYMAREKAIMDKYSALSEAEEKGIVKGIDIGREEGIGVGREEGERNKAIEASKKMIQDGLSLELISKYEGLSISELEQIKKEIEK